MNYNSWPFWLLFFCILLPYWRLRHRLQNALLLVVSYVFYGTWDYRFLFLILVSTVIDFIGGLGVAGVRLSRRRLLSLAALVVASSLLLCSNVNYLALGEALSTRDPVRLFFALPQRLADLTVPLFTAGVTLAYLCALPLLYAQPSASRRKYFLTISMVANLSILGFFKYCDFFIGSFQNLLSSLGASHLNTHTLAIILPAGISFYTFQAMSYTIDIYRGEVEPTENFGDFALFVCFFPHLVAGPIMRAHTLLPQVVQPRKLAPGAVGEGLLLIVLGLFKKLVIADNMAPIANAVFYPFEIGKAHGISGAEVLVGVYAFALQIYGDFSGYSSIARGVSKWLGFELVVNFNQPYLAVSPSDFWRRWHISLSTWLRDYLYIPLGGNRHGQLATYRNLMLTMLLGGLWHGANWTFVAWGLYQGFILCLFRLMGIGDTTKAGGLLRLVWWLFRVLLMFHLTCAGWLLFRADSFTTIYHMTRTLFTSFAPDGLPVAPFVLVLFYGLPLVALERVFDGENQLERFSRLRPVIQGALVGFLVLTLILFQAEQAHEFIYFQF
jgi:alginate O-acetyltransferase complex protein AlgI